MMVYLGPLKSFEPEELEGYVPMIINTNKTISYSEWNEIKTQWEENRDYSKPVILTGGIEVTPVSSVHEPQRCEYCRCKLFDEDRRCPACGAPA